MIGCDFDCVNLIDFDTLAGTLSHFLTIFLIPRKIYLVQKKKHFLTVNHYSVVLDQLWTAI